MTRALGALSAAVLACAAVGAGTAAAQTSPSAASNVMLCHGDAPAVACETADQWNGAGDHHQVAALVTDAEGEPVADAPVTFSEQGVGRFTTGGDEVVTATDAYGVASAVVTGDEPGRSDVFAELSSPECGQAGPTRSCASGPVTVFWEVPPPGYCSDGVDNDGDGLTDMDDDGCTGPEDPNEGTGDPLEAHWDRALSLRFGDWRRDRVVLFGRLRALGGGPQECVAGLPVDLLRRVDGRWVSAGRVTTSAEGWYVAVRRDRPGAYRATAPRRSPTVDGSYRTTCRRARVTKPHRHAP